MNVKAAVILVHVGSAERGRRRGAQDDVPANADPIPMAMAVEHDNTPCMRCQNRYEIRRIDQCQADALAQADRSHWIFDDLMMEQNEPPARGSISQNQFQRFEL